MVECEEQLLSASVMLRRDPLEVTPFDGAVLGSEFLAEQWLGRYLAQMGLMGAMVVAAACTPRVPTFTPCDGEHEGLAQRLVLVFQCDGKNWQLVRPDPRLRHAVGVPDLEFPETLNVTEAIGEPQVVYGYEHLGPLVEVCVRGADGSGCGVFVPAQDLGR